MIVKQGYRTELDLNNKQITLAKKHCGASRWAYNYGLRRKQEARVAGLPIPYATELHREINALKKAALAGSEVKIVSRWFPSSKTCSSCGTVKETLELSERVFVCEDCGYVADRDYNAAKVLAGSG